MVAWWVAARHAQRVERVVVIDGPHPDVLMQQAAKHPTQALRNACVAFFQLPWLPEAALGAFGFAALKATLRGSAKPGTVHAADLARYADAWARPGRLTAVLNYYRALRQRRPGGAPARITPPVLILWSSDDSFLDCE